MNTFVCYLGIGSNLENPRQQIARALQKLSATPSIKVLRHSPWYSSKAVGLDKKINSEQPDYINGVIEIETALDPQALLEAIQHIELAQGRTREVRWGARTLDIDILLYGKQQIHTDHLDIPHPRIMERNFVLIPLADIDPTIPVAMLTTGNPSTEKNETIASLISRVSREGLQLVNE